MKKMYGGLCPFLTLVMHQAPLNIRMEKPGVWESLVYTELLMLCLMHIMFKYYK